jgi:hypothetical protein
MIETGREFIAEQTDAVVRCLLENKEPIFSIHEEQSKLSTEIHQFVVLELEQFEQAFEKTMYGMESGRAEAETNAVKERRIKKF